MNKTKRKELLIILIMITCIAMLLIFLGSTFSFFKNEKTAQGQIQLGELDFTIQTSSNATSIMPGDKVDVLAEISNKVLGKTHLIPFYFRFKLTDSENYEANISANNFILGEDNFYYYKYKLLPDKKVQLFSSIKIKESLISENYIDVAIYVEAVQSEHDAYLEIFDNAPSEWLNFIKK